MARNYHFGCVPAAAIFDRRVTPAVLRVYAALCSAANERGWAKPPTGKTTATWLAEGLGLTKQTVSEHIQQLATLGWLRIERLPGDAGTFGRSVLWVVFQQPQMSPTAEDLEGLTSQEEPDGSRQGEPDRPGQGEPNRTCQGDPDHKKSQTRKEEQTKESDQTLSAADGDGAGAGFEDFWQAYPPRDGKKLGKQAARILYTKLVKDKLATPAELMDGLRFYKTTDTVRRGFPKDAVAWLNAKKGYWKDGQDAEAADDTDDFLAKFKAAHGAPRQNP